MREISAWVHGERPDMRRFREDSVSILFSFLVEIGQNEKLGDQ